MLIAAQRYPHHWFGVTELTAVEIAPTVLFCFVLRVPDRPLAEIDAQSHPRVERGLSSNSARGHGKIRGVLPGDGQRAGPERRGNSHSGQRYEGEGFHGSWIGRNKQVTCL